MAHEPIDEAERRTLLERPRPKRDLPLVGVKSATRRRLPLLGADEPGRVVPRPRHVVWELTLACDLACRHCGSRAAHRRPDELTLEQCLAVVESFASVGITEVSLIGGEAYLHEGWLEIIRAIVANGMDVGMTTGGRGFDRARAEAAAEAGLEAVSVSIDGNEESHDRLRGVRGAHASAVLALEAARAVGMQRSIITQLNRLSSPGIESVVDLAIAHEVAAWKFMLTVPMGRAADEPDVLLQPFDLLTLYPELVRAVERCEANGVAAWPGNNIGYFGPYESTLRARFPGKHRGPCAAGNSVLGVEAQGGVKGCPSLPSARWIGGNLLDDPLSEILARAPALRELRDRTVDDLQGFCRTCYYAEACMGGCVWTAEAASGHSGNNPYCHHRALELDARGQRERLVPIAPAPGEPFDLGRFEIILEDSGSPIYAG